MRVFDRYIIRQYLINFVILTLVLMTLFVVVDFIVNQDEFFEAGRLRADRMGGIVPATLYSIVDYYGPLLVLAYVYFSGLLAVGAAGFTLSSLERNHELIALTAGGISLYRVAAPVLIAGGVLGGITLPIQEMVIPPLASKLARGPGQVKADTLNSFAVHYAPDERGNLLSAARFNPGDQTLESVSILERDEDGRAFRRTEAELAHWDESSQAWTFPVTGYAIALQEQGRDGQAMGSPEPIAVASYETQLSPTVLVVRRASIFVRLLSIQQLTQMINSGVVDVSKVGQISQVIWGRFSLVAFNTLLLAMTLPFFMILRPPNMLLQAVKAAGVAIFAWGIGLGMLQILPGGVNPAMWAWLPVVFALPAAIGTMSMVRT